MPNYLQGYKLLWACVVVLCFARVSHAADALVLDAPPHATFHFGGILGRRIDANIQNWLVVAPRANPGMLEMFRQRDRQPPPNLVPWAGEFVGKYLISAIQSLRMSDDAQLKETTRGVVDRLIASQADDGYLGPFPKSQRLLANWDLWGHYHCMLALMLWHEATGDERALAACRRAADLASATYLDTPRRPLDAGSPEMNLAIIHVLGRLYRATREERYLKLARAIEQDWERAGDYFRTGLAGVDFYRTPSPRWESLHDLQGLVELYFITGDARYKQSFLHHWQSIRRFDRHNTGAFSSGEQATGHPYAPGAIETCCTIAWMAVTVDALRLSGDPAAADELELSTYNSMAGSQHPSGRWWTYNTPMDGLREASAHSIVFQARAGTPELNCCSVNGPRGLGVLSEWAVMQAADGIAVNYYGPGQVKCQLADGTPLELSQRTAYPVDPMVTIELNPARESHFKLRLRIPGWSSDTEVQVNGERVANVVAGKYLDIDRAWQPKDLVTLRFDMRLRVEPGDEEMFGRASIYRGPLLLAYDQRFNAFDEEAIPVLDAAGLKSAAVATPIEAGAERDKSAVQVIESDEPWLLVDIPTGGDTKLRLCDFATAGSRGTRYRSWLAVKDLPPPRPAPTEPADGTALAPGPLEFHWRMPAAADIDERKHRVLISESADMAKPRDIVGRQESNAWIVAAEEAHEFKPGTTYYWKILATNAHGEAASLDPPKTFRIDPKLPPREEPAGKPGDNVKPPEKTTEKGKP